MIKEDKKKEYEEYFLKQVEILKGHFDRFVLRNYNKYMELMLKEDDKKG